MAKASKETIQKLDEIIDRAALGLRGTKTKKMFGCHALFNKDSVYGLVWKEGRIGVKLTDESVYQKLMKLKGAGHWKAGNRTMG